MKKRRSRPDAPSQTAQSKKQPRTGRPRTERPQTERPKLPATPGGGERQSQVTLQMRESLHQELARRAFESGMTMRGFIMRSLKRSGLQVTEADLVDRRRRNT